MTALDKANSGASGPLRSLEGATIRDMFAVAAAWIERNASAIDAINVFPVPDGDTGSNLSQTMRAALDAIVTSDPHDTPSSRTVLRGAARGALLGARGNSGVILSQWLRGLAESVRGDCGIGDLSRALALADEAARGAIGEPREGTILSVTAVLAGPQDANADGDLIGFFQAMHARARDAVDRTPHQMQLLADAGVVDAGALGLATIVEGFSLAIAGVPIPEVAADAGDIDPSWRAASQQRAPSDGFGFCTEFVIRGPDLNPAVIRAALTEIGDSVVIVGDESLLHAHLHTADPERAFATARDFGTLAQKKADDMSAQHATLVGRASGQFPDVAIVAVASGAGFTNLFHDLGVAAVVPGGPMMNPSAEAIMRAAATTHAGSILVLPNDGNIIAAANQASRLAHDDPTAPRLVVVPTESQAAGVAALTAFDRSAGAEANASEMAEAATAIITGAVTFAARDVASPVQLRRGQPFALLGSEIVAGATTTHQALLLLIDSMRGRNTTASLLTLYQGVDLSPDAASLDHDAVSERFGRSLEVELVIGGQPHYPWIVALE
ncbi:MAG TPA: DAK2 domain-containing protein [Dehalococcoidia bacterium]|nr:DAK2 domain-containing protein [Dehalococcoidia bacterium]